MLQPEPIGQQEYGSSKDLQGVDDKQTITVVAETDDLTNIIDITRNIIKNMGEAERMEKAKAHILDAL